MRIRYLLYYVAGALLVMAPVGLRILSWRTSEVPLDEAMVQEGRMLFHHEWKPNDPLSPGGDGLGPVYNAASCVACHHLGGTGGAGGLPHNVTVFSVPSADADEKPKDGVLHANAVGRRETLADLRRDLPQESQPSLEFVLASANIEATKNASPPIPALQLAQRNTPALFGARLIDAIPDRVIILTERKQQARWGKHSKTKPIGRALRLADGRIGKFGWKAQSASLSDFVQAACANELGLGNPGAAQPRPLGKQNYEPPGLDLTLEQCNQLTVFIASLPAPREVMPAEPAKQAAVENGKGLFLKIGCADCHMPSIGSVDGIYSDLLLHHMGESLMTVTGSYNGPSTIVPSIGPSTDSPADEWRTPPLWGIADSAPYLHDGRAPTLEKAIELHGGQAVAARQRFERLAPGEKTQLIDFLKALRAP